MEEEKSQNSLSDKIKKGWKSLPLAVRIQIIAGIGGVVALILIIATVAALIPTIFLNYSDEVQQDQELKNAYEEFWMDFCEDGDASCSEEQIAAAKHLEESQTKFYQKLDKYVLTKEQRYMVLSTIFYNYDIEDFTEGNSAFTIDDTVDIDYSVDENANVYKREIDSIKELVKQFTLETAYCVTKTKNEQNEDVTEEVMLKDSSGQPFTFGFFEKFQITIGISPNKEFSDAKANCSGTVEMRTTTDSKESIENYYKYLRESDYLDTRPQNREIFMEYGKNRKLPDDINSWADEDRIAVRDDIIQDIKDIVSGYMASSSTSLEYLSFSSSDAYWWPVGSLEVTEANGKEYALGDPASTGINSYFAGRIHPVTHKPSTHSGMDLAGGGSRTPIIAAKSGVVVYPGENDPVSYPNGEKVCGVKGDRTYGNYVVIQHADGNATLYAHLAPNSIKVHAGESVERGQVIGYMGNTGCSTGTHLHFEVREGKNSYNNRVDPLNYINPDDPRPKSLLSDHFVEWFDANFEGSTGTDPSGTMYLVKDVGDGKRTVGPGVTLDAQRDKFASRGINVDDYQNGSYISKELVDSIKLQVLEEAASSIQTTLSNAGLTLENEKIEALVVFKYNVGNIKGFVDSYKQYGDTDLLFDNYFAKHVHVNGEYWPGLMKRRQKEWELFHNHVYV